MVAGGNGFICDECVLNAAEMISAQHPDWAVKLVAMLDHAP